MIQGFTIDEVNNTFRDGARVFISYSRTDIQFVKRLIAALEERGFEVDIDRTDIEKGEDWWNRVKELISGADTVVFAVSPDSLKSTVIADELEYADSFKKRILPIIIADVASGDVPATMARLNYVYFIPNPAAGASGNFDDGVRDLIRALSIDLRWIREHTRLSLLAQRWKEGDGPTLRGRELRAAEAWLSRRPRDPPEPTEQHLDHIFHSRRAANVRLWTVVGLSLLAVAISATLAVVAEWQRTVARDRLVAQRVANGSDAVLSGNPAAGLDWYANALSLSGRSSATELPHRIRLAALANEAAMTKSLWRENGRIGGLAFSDDGRILAVLVEGETITLNVYNLDTGERVAQHSLETDVVEHLEILPGGTIAVVMWFTKGTRRIVELSATDDTVLATHVTRSQSYRITPDGKVKEPEIAIGSGQDVLALDAATGAVAIYDDTRVKFDIHLKTDEGHRVVTPRSQRIEIRRRPRTAVFFPDGNQLITFHYDDAARIWSIGPDGATQTGSLDHAFDNVETAVFDPAGQLLVTEKRSDDRRFTTHWSFTEKAPRLIATFDHDQALRRWEFPQDTQRDQSGAGAGSGMGGSIIRSWMFLRPDATIAAGGARLVTFSELTRSFRIWDLYSGLALTPRLLHGNEEFEALAVSGDGRFAATGTRSGTVRVLDVALPRWATPPVAADDPVRHLEFNRRAPGELLVSYYNTADVVDWRSGEVLHKWKGAAGFDPTGTWIAVREAKAVKFLQADDQDAPPVIVPFDDADKLFWSEDGGHVLITASNYSDPSTYVLIEVSSERVLNAGTVPAIIGDSAYVSTRFSRAYIAYTDRKTQNGQILEIRYGDGKDATLRTLPTSNRVKYFVGDSDRCVVAMTLDETGCIATFLGAAGTSARPASTPQFQRMIAARSDHDLMVVTDTGGKIVQAQRVSTSAPYSPVFDHNWSVTGASVAPDSDILATWSGNRAHLWDLESGLSLVPQFTLPDTVTAVAYDPKLGLLAASSKSRAAGADYAIFFRSVEPIEGTEAELRHYAMLHSGHAIDEAGGRVPVAPERLTDEAATLPGTVWPRLSPPTDPVFWRTELLRSARYIVASIPQLEALLALTPDDADVRMSLARHYGYVERIDEAIAQHAILFDNGDFRSARNFMETMNESGRFEEAVAKLGDALRNPLHAPSSNRANIRFQLGDYTGASSDYSATSAPEPPKGKALKRQALAAELANDTTQLAWLCDAAFTAAREGADTLVERWNAAYYAAVPCASSPQHEDTLVDLVDIMRANQPDQSRVALTLTVYDALIAFRQGDFEQTLSLAAGHRHGGALSAARYAARSAMGDATPADIRSMNALMTHANNLTYRTFRNADSRAEIAVWLKIFGLWPH